MLGGSAKGRDNRRKLSDFDVSLIRTLKAMGARQSDIARHYGVSDATVSMIVRNRYGASRRR